MTNTPSNPIALETRASRGFTLIELLVVISIIGVLSTIVLASLNSARAKSRDTVRYQTMVQLRTALARYYSENGSYPVSLFGNWMSSEPGDNIYNGPWIPGLVPTYISTYPRDPVGKPGGNCTLKMAYYYFSDGNHYKIMNCSIEGGYPPATNPFYDPQRPGFSAQITDDKNVTSSW